MAGGKQTPRQRMINILYLVLLGLIALNVPDNLLDAFKNITDSLDSSRVNVETGVQNTFTAFEATKLKEQPERAKPFYDRAKEASKVVNELNAYVEQLKAKMITEGGGMDDRINDVRARDNMDISARLMINQKNGEELRKKIETTRQKLLALLDEKDRASTKFSLNAQAPKQRAGIANKNWEEAYFGNGIPLGAALTSLAKVQADAKNAESETVKKILGKVDQAVVNLDQFAAVAVAPTSYVIQGQPYTAEVFLTASDSKSSPSISVNGSSLQVSEGRGKYTVGTNSEGVFTWVGTIRVQQNDGSIKEYKTAPQQYQVARPSAVVSPDKMNVFYIGVPNPVSVSAPGIPKESLKVSMNGGSINGSNGKYTVNVSSVGNASVNVSGTINGKSVSFGATNFRVKRIPDPKAKFAGKTSGSMPSATIKAQDFIAAVLEGFDFEAKFNITRYTLIVAKPRADVNPVTGNGNALNAASKAALAGVTPGTQVIFTDIIAVGPDGSQRALEPIVIRAN
jgi:gliding motility-associated protein GldM